MFLSELSRNNLIISMCPFLQATINAVNLLLSLMFSPLSSELQYSKSSCTTFVSPFLHASNILPFHLLIKTLPARTLQVCETSRHLTNPGVSMLSKIRSPTCGIPRLITLSILNWEAIFLKRALILTPRHSNLKIQVAKCYQIIFLWYILIILKKGDFELKTFLSLIFHIQSFNMWQKNRRRRACFNFFSLVMEHHQSKGGLSPFPILMTCIIFSSTTDF